MYKLATFEINNFMNYIFREILGDNRVVKINTNKTVRFQIGIEVAHIQSFAPNEITLSFLKNPNNFKLEQYPREIYVMDETLKGND